MAGIASVIVSARLKLRPAQSDDADTLHENYFANPYCSRYLKRRPHQTINQTRAALRRFAPARQGTKARRWAWIVALKNKDVPVGMFFLMREVAGYEIHFGIARAYWGQGLVTEAGCVVLAMLARTIGSCVVRSYCESTHTASARVLEKLGFQRSKESPGHVFPAFGPCPRKCMAYVLTLPVVPADKRRDTVSIALYPTHRQPITISPEPEERCDGLLASPGRPPGSG
jgi:ribosomal-protein-alanine N-acetyltransferase